MSFKAFVIQIYFWKAQVLKDAQVSVGSRKRTKRKNAGMDRPGKKGTRKMAILQVTKEQRIRFKEMRAAQKKRWRERKAEMKLRKWRRTVKKEGRKLIVTIEMDKDAVKEAGQAEDKEPGREERKVELKEPESVAEKEEDEEDKEPEREERMVDLKEPESVAEKEEHWELRLMGEPEAERMEEENQPEIGAGESSGMNVVRRRANLMEIAKNITARLEALSQKVDGRL